jgi:hypothetical protein
VEKLKQFNLHDVSSSKQKEDEGISQLAGTNCNWEIIPTKKKLNCGVTDSAVKMKLKKPEAPCVDRSTLQARPALLAALVLACRCF